MKLWVKVCGLRTRADVETAATAGADAIGFVFAPSSRRVTPAEAASAAAAAPPHVRRVAVFLHPTQAEVDQVLAGFHPDLIQTDAADFAALRLPADLERLPVLRAGAAADATVSPSTAATALTGEIMAGTARDSVRRWLVEGPRSGSGQVADWRWAASLATQGQVILAGGLHAGNVAAAVAAVRPWGIDVSSGVESAPGVKDAALIRSFLKAARLADGSGAAVDG